MNKITGKITALFFSAVMVAAVFTIQPGMAQGTKTLYEPLMEKGVLNASTVWGEGDSQFKLDSDGGFFSSALSTSGSLPNNGKISIGGVPYTLHWTGSSPYSGKDSIRLSNSAADSTTTIKFDKKDAFEQVYILATASGFDTEDGRLEFDVKLTYADGTSDTDKYILNDWYYQPGANAKAAFRRTKNGVDVDSYTSRFGPSVYMQSRAVKCDSSKILESITMTRSRAGLKTYVGIYAVTGKRSESSLSAFPAPKASAATNVENTAFTANWDAVSGSTGYILDVSATADFSSLIPEYSNKDVGNVTSVKISGLSPSTKYYYRVRAINGSDKSQVSNTITVQTTAAVIAPGQTQQTQQNSNTPGSGNKSPKTADNINLHLWSVIFLLTAGGAIALKISDKRKNTRQN